MTLENWVKIEDGNEQKYCSKITKALKCKKLKGAIRSTKPQIFFGKKVFLVDHG